jgi:hypothetical protein
MRARRIRSRAMVEIIAIVVTTCFLLSCKQPKQELGEDIVKRIERFRQDNKRLPDSLSELGVKEKLEGPVYYKKSDEHHYTVWYGTSVGESMTYNSDTGRWSAHN